MNGADRRIKGKDKPGTKDVSVTLKANESHLTYKHVRHLKT